MLQVMGDSGGAAAAALLKDPVPGTRQAAAEALNAMGKFISFKYIDEIAALLTDTDKDVRKAAAGAIKGMGEDGLRLSRKARSARDRTIRTFHIRVRSKFCQSSVHFDRKLKNSGFLNHCSTFSKVKLINTSILFEKFR